jgi:PAS domain S-box-containing protein
MAMSAPDFRVLFESVPGLHLAVLPDAPHYTIAAVSDAYLQATLTRREDLLGRGLFEAFQGTSHTGDRRHLLASLRRVADTSACDAMPVRRHDVGRPADKGGGLEERWWITINSPALGSDGKLAYLIHSVEDVTSLVRLRQEELKLAQAAPEGHAPSLHSGAQATGLTGEDWEAVFEHAADGILIADARCDRIVGANAAASALLGDGHDELVGSRLLRRLGLKKPGALAQLRDELRADGIVSCECTVQRRDGASVHLEVRASLLSDGRCLALLRNAERRQQREQMARARAVELEQRVVERTQLLRRLVVELETAESRERRQIARDLHDDLGQLLAAASIRLAGLCRDTREDVRQAALEIAGLVDQANRSMRSLAAQLEPAVLFELGLVPALHRLAEEISARYEISVRIVDDGQAKPLPPEERSIVYRAVRELLINVAKHADVKRATVIVTRDGTQLQLRVVDAGTGFAPHGANAAGGSNGLAIVRERMAFIGGSCEVRSVPGDGTEVTLRLPIDPDQG